jgi:hypothetical protein|tara:strand:- start:1328 stop:1594 length:267 start_codon:yes stop_codon:yes gene_type:complete
MKLKELKELIEGCHPEDLNNNLEAVVVTSNNNVFSTESIRLDTDSGRIMIAAKNSDNFEVNNHNADKEMEFALKMITKKREGLKPSAH